MRLLLTSFAFWNMLSCECGWLIRVMGASVGHGWRHRNLPREAGNYYVDITRLWWRGQPRIIINVLRHIVVHKQTAMQLDRIPQHLVRALIIHDRPWGISSATTQI